MLGAKRLLVAGERRPRQLQPFVGSPAGDQRERQLTTLTIGLRMIGAEAPHRPAQQILTRQDRLHPLVLLLQSGFERFPTDDAEGDQIFADPTAAPFLARQRQPDVVFGCQPPRDEKFTKPHNTSHAPSPPLRNVNIDNK